MSDGSGREREVCDGPNMEDEMTDMPRTELSESQRAFLEEHHSAAMITTGRDGTPRVARVGIAFVDGNLWSSGTNDRVRTSRLRSDPRCTVFVFDAGWSWLALDTAVRILDGPDAPELNLRLFRIMQDRPTGSLDWFGRDLDEEEFLGVMAEEHRLVYEFDVIRGYGMV